MSNLSTHSSNQARSSGSSGDNIHLQISNVTKRFGDVTACEDITIDIGGNEFIVFLGPSGCGKTTTLRCIAGLEDPDEGKIRVGDEDVTYKKPKDRNLAFVFQNVALFPHMSVARNIRFGLDMQTDLTTEEKSQRVREAAEMLDIEDKLDQKPSALSGGQQQRVSLGRAMVMDPEAFLLDEPFSALDAKLRDQMRVEIQKLQQQLNLAMIFVTHDQEEAMMLGDRIVIMDAGEIEQIGTPAEIYNDPNNRFVADFIGSPATNFIECTIDRRGEEVTLRTDLFALPLSSEQAEKLDTDVERATIGIRPHELNIATMESNFEADVTVVEPHGDRDAVFLQAGDWEPTILTESGHYEQGETVNVELPVERAWLFDGNGNRLF
jgi:multiple sugar transport system ATP-binding protein